MSGILDNKKRVIDALITNEGKRQLAEGGLRISSYSFSDAGTFYKSDSDNGSADATVRLYLEASNLPQDSITFESNDAGNVSNVLGSDVQVIDGQIVEFTIDPDSSTTSSVLTGDQLAVQVDALLLNSIDNFQKLRVVTTNDELFDDDQFGVGNDAVQFTISDKKPISNRSLWTTNLNNEESIFNDSRFSNSINFQYLPPLNRLSDNVDRSDAGTLTKSRLGNYPQWNSSHVLDSSTIHAELDFYESIGFGKTIVFDPTSRQNNLLIQIFERKNDRLVKLDVVDAGEQVTNNVHERSFFVGKLLIDDNDNHTFVHLFTLVFK